MTSRRICIVYDCLFPWTIGGAERWYRRLAERAAQEGYEVTYLTLRQWDNAAPPALPGVKVVAVGPRLALYKGGKRRIVPPLLFGFGVLIHLLRHGRRYDSVCTASFPFFSLLSIGILSIFFRYKIFVDWIEVWTKEYWLSYLGPVGGRVGWFVQRLCARIPHRAYSFSALHALRASTLLRLGDVVTLPGFYPGGEVGSTADAVRPPSIIYAGRMIAEKRVSLLVEALDICMARDSSIRAVLYGLGPESERIAAKIAGLGLADRITMPGFVRQEEIDLAMATAAVLVQPSEREGYGIVVVESAARGVPVVVTDAPDNAAMELVENGTNGFIVPDVGPQALANGIMLCIEGGEALRFSTKAWYVKNAERVTIDASINVVLSDVASTNLTNNVQA